MSEPITGATIKEALTTEEAKRRSSFSLYRKTALTPISDATFPPGTVFQTPEGLRAEDEESRAALDVQGGIYPIRESVFRASYELNDATPLAGPCLPLDAEGAEHRDEDHVPITGAAIKARDLIANFLWNEDDSGDENNLLDAYDLLRETIGPSTEESLAETLAAIPDDAVLHAGLCLPLTEEGTITEGQLIEASRAFGALRADR